MIDISRSDKNWEAEFVDIKYSCALEIAKDENIKEISIYYDFGYSEENASDYDMEEKIFKPGSIQLLEEPFYMRAYDDNAIKNANLKLIKGRMPVNSDEIIVCESQMTSYKDGEKTYAFDVEEELELTFNGEKKKYKIVGMVEDLEEQSNNMPDLRQGLITYLDEKLINQDTIVSVRVLSNNVQKICKTCDNLVETLNLEKIPNKNNENTEIMQSEFYQEFQNMIKEEFGRDINEQSIDNSNEKVRYNTELLSYEMVTDVDDTFRNIVLVIGGGFTLIISIVAILVIYTSFKMTYSERIRELGMLSSIRNE